MSQLKKIVPVTLAAALALSVSNAQAACFLWTDYDGRGQGYVMNDNTAVNFNNSLPGKYLPDFAGKVSSVATNNGCKATLFLNNNQGHMNFEGSRVNLQGSQNDAAMGVKCSC